MTTVYTTWNGTNASSNVASYMSNKFLIDASSSVVLTLVQLLGIHDYNHMTHHQSAAHEIFVEIDL